MQIMTAGPTRLVFVLTDALQFILASSQMDRCTVVLQSLPALVLLSLLKVVNQFSVFSTRTCGRHLPSTSYRKLQVSALEPSQLINNPFTDKMRTLFAILVASCMAAILYPLRDFILENYVFTPTTSEDVRQALDLVGGLTAVMMWLPVYNILTGSNQINPILTVIIIYGVPAVTKKLFFKKPADAEASSCSQSGSDQDEIISALLEQLRALKKEGSEIHKSLEQCLLTSEDVDIRASSLNFDA
jgi:hypothetical protein